MLFKKLFLFLFLISSSAFAHKVAGVDMSLEKLENDKILVQAFYQKSKKALVENEVRLISMFDNRILNKGKLTRDGLILDIPTESYWVYVLVRDNDIVQNGLPPKDGFKKQIKLQEVAFLYTALASIGLLLLALFIAYRKNHSFKRTLH